MEQPKHFQFSYDLDQPLKAKIETIVRRVYGGAGVAYSGAADKELARLEELGFGGLPVCMAKTQYSLSDDPAKLGRPEGFTVTVSKVKVSAGRGLRGGPDRRHHDHAGPAQGAGGGEDRRGRERCDFRIVLSPAWSFPPQVRRTSVLRSKTLAQGEFTSPEPSNGRGPHAGLTRGEAMPGLPKVPAAEKIDVDENGVISGLF